jgi:hypothetical protein
MAQDIRGASDNKDNPSDVFGRWRFRARRRCGRRPLGYAARSWRFGLFPDLSVELGQPALRILAGPSASLLFRLVSSRAVCQLVCMRRLEQQS